MWNFISDTTFGKLILIVAYMIPSGKEPGEHAHPHTQPTHPHTHTHTHTHTFA